MAGNPGDMRLTDWDGRKDADGIGTAALLSAYSASSRAEASPDPATCSSRSSSA